VVSYQTAYMKANFPVEFMAAVMTAESGDEEKIYAAVEECSNLGISVLPPNVNESLGDFTVVDDHTIRFGLNAIKNLGSDVIGKIIDVRELEKLKIRELGASSENLIGFHSIEDFLVRTHTKNLNKKSWEALVKAGALDDFGERGQLLANTEEVLQFTRDFFRDENSRQNSLFGKSETMGKIRLREASPATKEEKLLWEKEHLGLYVSSHPLENYREVLKSFTSVKDLRPEHLGTNHTIGGIISRLKRTLTKKNDPMAFFTLSDLTGSLEVLVFSKTLEKALPFLQNDKIVQVVGRLSDKDEEFKLLAEEIKELPTDELYTMALSEMEKNKQVVLHMSSVSNPGSLNIVKEILQKYPGNAQVYISLGSGPGAKKIKTHSQIRIDTAIIKQLREIPEVVMVDVE